MEQSAGSSFFGDSSGPQIRSDKNQNRADGEYSDSGRIQLDLCFCLQKKFQSEFHYFDQSGFIPPVKDYNFADLIRYRFC
jgi:hypothetical protein